MSKQVYPEPTVGALILNKKNEMLLCKSPKWFDKYTMPGGHIELGETIQDAIKREIMEEVGLKIKPIKILDLQDVIYTKEYHKPKHFVFLDILCKAITTKVKKDNKEITNFIWVKPEKALKMKTNTFTRNTINQYLKEKGE
jgi:nucleoside triphosphatase